MRNGIATTDFPITPLVPLLDQIAGYGFECVQLSLASLAECGFTPTGQDEIPPHIEDGLLRRLGQELSSRGLTLSAINGIYNLAHPDPAVREEGLRRFEGLARATRALGCPIITLSSGSRNAEHVWSPHPDNTTQAAWDTMISSLEDLLPIAGRYGLILAVETEAANVIDTPEKARRMMDGLASPHLKMVMDCANLFHAGRAQASVAATTIRHAFALFGRDVVLAHGKDIRESEGIEFCTTGQGIVDFPLFLQELQAYAPGCDMILHGIKSADQIPGALAFIRQVEAAMED